MKNIYRRLYSILTSFFIILLVGCTFGYSMYDNQATYIPVAAPGQATITFFWPNSYLTSVTATIAMQNSEGGLSLIGDIAAQQRVVQVLNPGEYTYVISGDGADVLKANLAADKHYFVQVNANWGMVNPKFTFNPISPQQITLDPGIRNEIANCVYVNPNIQGQELFELNYPELMKKLADPTRTTILKASEGIDHSIGQ